MDPPEDGIEQNFCPWCGNFTPVPKVDPERFNHANKLRLEKQFDLALAEFEQLAAEKPNDCEIYWNLVLCRYGIEYVDDVDGTKKPTCNRMSYDSIFEDPDYQLALEYADGESHMRYQEMAAEINRVLSEIAGLARRQKQVDVFISYKETDGFGQRTLDSTYAQSLYDELTRRGFEVFLSRVSLKDYAAMEYEPIIFSALQSAKVMVVIGTSREYLESPWVRNEWSRFKVMMDRDSQKKMAIVYKNMDISDLPEEFGLMKKEAIEAGLGFEQDLGISIENLIGSKRKPEASVYTSVNDIKVDNLIKRGMQEIEHGHLDKAREYFDKVLEEYDAEQPDAWWGLFLVRTDNLQRMNIQGDFLTIDAENAWSMVEQHATGTTYERYHRAYEEYHDRYLKAQEDYVTAKELENNTREYEKQKKVLEETIDQTPVYEKLEDNTQIQALYRKLRELAAKIGRSREFSAFYEEKARNRQEAYFASLMEKFQKDTRNLHFFAYEYREDGEGTRQLYEEAKSPKQKERLEEQMRVYRKNEKLYQEFKKIQEGSHLTEILHKDGEYKALDEKKFSIGRKLVSIENRKNSVSGWIMLLALLPVIPWLVLYLTQQGSWDALKDEDWMHVALQAWVFLTSVSVVATVMLLLVRRSGYTPAFIIGLIGGTVLYYVVISRYAAQLPSYVLTQNPYWVHSLWGAMITGLGYVLAFIIVIGGIVIVISGGLECLWVIVPVGGGLLYGLSWLMERVQVVPVDDQVIYQTSTQLQQICLIAMVASLAARIVLWIINTQANSKYELLNKESINIQSTMKHIRERIYKEETKNYVNLLDEEYFKDWKRVVDTGK
jgi:hypothetical protein